jgi:hypothetical protein
VLVVLAMNGAIAVAIIFVALAWTAADARFGPTLGKSFGILSIVVMTGYTIIILIWLTQVACSLDRTLEQCRG